MSAPAHPLPVSGPTPGPDPPPAPRPQPIAPLATVSGLTKRFRTREVLRGVGLTLRPGCVTAVVGPNGSGKTTLIKCFLGLVRPDAGHLVFDGEDLEPGDVAYRARIGYMPQAARFPEHLTGREVLAMLRDLRAVSAGATDDALIAAFGLEAELDKPLRTLSGGTRQKLNAAAAFLFRPDLVVLDEPTAGLDPIASAALRDKVEAATDAGAAGLLTSHIVSELEALADDLVFLMDGRVRFSGTVAELKHQAGHDRLDRALAHLMTAPSR
ncbi:MAG: ABC transporter ATP-binding protein [Rubricoccaceae bacterium]|nr:ABC transporter ATP-binding protein [Rubricoccaceae bacterium]